MARSKEHIEKRNAKMRKDYESLRATKEGRKPKYTAEHVISMLAEKYFLSERRIEDIVWAKEPTPAPGE